MLTGRCDEPRPAARAGLKSRAVHRGQHSQVNAAFTRQSGRFVSKEHIQENMYQLVGGRTGCSQTLQHSVNDIRGRWRVDYLVILLSCIVWRGHVVVPNWMEIRTLK